MNSQPSTLVAALSEARPLPGVFNPWRDIDPAHDLGPQSPQIRRAQLQGYLARRIGKARLIFIGEALGYQGGHFSGIAMSSERILLGHKEKDGIPSQAVLSNPSPQRTSRPQFRPLGFSEPTGTIAWKALLGLGLDPDEFVLWNAFAWHPYSLKKGLLSNRKPTPAELEFGFPFLREFLQLFSPALLIAVGRVSEGILEKGGWRSYPVRHPANGGATKFRQQVEELLIGGLLK